MLRVNSPRILGFEAYLLFWYLAWFTGLALFAWNRSRQNKDPKVTLFIGLGVFVSSVFGGRFFYFLNHPELSWKESFSLSSGGLVLLGGLVSALVFLKAYCLLKKSEDFWRLCDLIVLCFVPAVALGRIGCLIEGCCHGVPTNAPWGVEYTFGAAALSFPNQSLVPTQLIEFIALIAIYGLIFLSKKRLRPSFVFLASYSVFRFFLEFWRGDFIRGSWGPFSSSQALTLLLMFGSLVAYFFGLWRVKKA